MSGVKTSSNRTATDIILTSSSESRSRVTAVQNQFYKKNLSNKCDSIDQLRKEQFTCKCCDVIICLQQVTFKQLKKKKAQI